MKLLILLIGPTIMIFIGLPLLHNILITFLLFYGWLLFVPLLVTNWSKINHYRMQLTFSIKSIILGTVSGLICLISVYGFVFVFQSFVLDIPKLNQLLMEWDFTGTKVLLLALVLILINPILEEFYWREFIYQRLFEKNGSTKTILITSLFYSLYHLIVVVKIFTFPFNALAVIPIFLAGILWGIFRLKLKSIAAPIISHSLADIGIMLVYWNIILSS
ncbi:CPBP family intramembrane glutamic endopeptidase [Psychrobacillus vulpis]|uniref:CPBP family intramembrane metalloprotease n=1 Tax=Psychrobacillus vulpis TaxID=2325572 RepID=A0A544TKQ6_9BACI|nr:type II CAAX endopeptidase family protein [Psychrobacillus vulpis]TQR18031.1 CPBP family intramembrane metalloprotease [Psychrobacillus vulpis]